MITIKLYGMFRQSCKEHEFSIAASTVGEALSQLAALTNIPEKVWKQGFVFVNKVSFDRLKMYKTPLSDGDVVAILSPASGG